MTHRQIFVFLAAAVFLVQGPIAASALSDEAILHILKTRVDTFNQSVGIVVGIVDSSGTRIVGYGPRNKGGADVVDGSTIFEIGSISKVFTSIVLADMIRKGEVSLRDPVSRYLPAEVILPTRSGREISLLDLVTHRSGLPRTPDHLQVAEPGGRNSFPVDQMYEVLSTTILAYDIGERYYYSNLAFGLLGKVLANRADTDFESLLLERVCRPLSLSDTRVNLNAEQQERMAGAHNWNHDETPPLEWDTMTAAGGVRSTVGDLLTFLSANMGLHSSDLWFPLQMAHLDRRETSRLTLKVGLGWHILSIPRRSWRILKR